MTAHWRRRIALAMLAGGATLSGAGLAEDEDAADDADLLEFIGSWEGDDEDWLEILDAQGDGFSNGRDSEKRAPQPDDDDGYQ